MGIADPDTLKLYVRSGQRAGGRPEEGSITSKASAVFPKKDRTASGVGMSTRCKGMALVDWILCIRP